MSSEDLQGASCRVLAAQPGSWYDQSRTPVLLDWQLSPRIYGERDIWI